MTAQGSCILYEGFNIDLILWKTKFKVDPHKEHQALVLSSWHSLQCTPPADLEVTQYLTKFHWWVVEEM